mgnify:CR=1 FL=1|jgi:hypothetical protein
MNLILYYSTICSIIYYGLPMIGSYTEDPLLQKLYFLICMLGVNYVFFLLSGILSSSSKKSWSEITDKSFLGSFAVLCGLLIYYDLDDNDVVSKVLPQINDFYTEKWFSLLVIMLPMVFLSLVKILFSDP